MNEKLQKLNNLKNEIDEVSQFLDLLKIGDVYNIKYKGQNNFTTLIIKADVWTGTDNPEYRQTIDSSSIISEIVKVMIPILEIKKRQLESEFTNLLN